MIIEYRKLRPDMNMLIDRQQHKNKIHRTVKSLPIEQSRTMGI